MTAFLIDSVNLYTVLGRNGVVALSTAFYNRVYSDTENQWFMDIFDGHTKEESIQNQYEFFIQRWGGPPLYSQRKGHPALKARHVNFKVTPRSAVRWLQHMSAAMDDVKIPDHVRPAMKQFFNHVAAFLVNTPEDPNEKIVTREQTPEAVAAEGQQQATGHPA